MRVIGTNVFTLTVISFYFTPCAGQINTCSDHLNGQAVVAWDAIGNPLIFSLNSRKKEDSELFCRNEDFFLPFTQTDMQLLSEIYLPSQQLPTTRDRYFTKNGMFGLKEGIDTHYYYPEEFCIAMKGNKFQNVSHGRILGIRICRAKCEGNTPCIQKCCPMEHSFDLRSRSCEPTKLAWSPFLYSHETSANFTEKAKFRPHYIYHVLQCPLSQDGETQNIDAWYGQSVSEENSSKRTKFKLLEDGSIVAIGQRRKWSRITAPHFCIDAMTNSSIMEKVVISENKQIVFVCADNKAEKTNRLKSLLYSGVMYFASIFLLLTCLYYIILWDEQNIHGWTTFSFVLSMFFMFICLGTSNILTYVSNTSSYTFRSTLLCVSVGVLAHFSFLSTFTWLTIVNMDLFFNFGSTSVSDQKSKELSRYCVYATVAWGIPIIVVAIGLIMGHIYPDNESLIPIPDYGREVCFIVPSAQGIYLYYIISFLQGINLMFITATCYNFYNTQKDALYTRSNKSASQNCNSNTFVIVSKLFVVMGLSWVFEIISWMATKEENDQAWYWYVSDLYNLCQAILIFKIFVCKKSTAARLQKKYPFCKRKNSETEPFVKIYRPIS